VASARGVAGEAVRGQVGEKRGAAAVDPHRAALLREPGRGGGRGRARAIGEGVAVARERRRAAKHGAGGAVRRLCGGGARTFAELLSKEQLLNVALLPRCWTPTAPPYCARRGGVAAAGGGG
jgi:hypothetical protein